MKNDLRSLTVSDDPDSTASMETSERPVPVEHRDGQRNLEHYAKITPKRQEAAQGHEKESVYPVKKSSVDDTVRAQRQGQKDVGQLYDELIVDLGGDGGLYQQRIIFLVVLPCFFMLAFVQCVVAFVVANPTDYWCNVPELDDGPLSNIGITNMTEDLRQDLMPWDLSSGSPDSCHRYNVNFTAMLLIHGLNVDSVVKFLNTTPHNFTMSLCRDGWDYDMQHGDTSIVTEWHLVCDASTLKSLATVLMAVASVLGILVAGYVSDRWGRKKPFFIFFLIMLVFGVSFAFAPSFEGFLALAILHSFGSAPIYLILYTMAVEMLTASSRLTMVVWLSIVYSVGAIIFTLIAYFVQEWRYLTIYGTSPFVLVFIYCFFLPESPRWLLVQERFPEVEKYVRRIAGINGCLFNISCQEQLKQIFQQCTREVDLQDESSVDSFDGKHVKKQRVWCSRPGSWIWLFATRPMLHKTLLLTYIITTLQICYFGLRAYTPPIVGSDTYFTTFLSNIIEIPGICFAWLVCARFGRRVSVMVSFSLSFLTCIITLAFPAGPDFFWGIIAVFLIARIFISAAYVTGELLVYETFPTVIRMQGVAITGAVAYVFSHLGPFIVKLRYHSDSLPLVVFGCLALIAVLCVFILPETIGTALPETVEEADLRGTGIFRRAVNSRRPAVRVKKSQSVLYHKSNGGFQAKTAEVGHGNDQSRGRPAVVTVPADNLPRSQQAAPVPTPTNTGSPAEPLPATPQLNQPDGKPVAISSLPSTNGRPHPAVHQSEITRVAASLKRVPTNKNVHFTVGADGQDRDNSAVPGGKDEHTPQV